MTLVQALADLLFPIECLGCGRNGRYLCDACLARIPRQTERACPVCRRTSVHGRTCLACAAKTPLDGIFAAARYDHPLVRATIHAHKYRFIESISAPLAELLREEIHNAGLPLPHAILPVPLHARRLRLRNFNQAELLAQRLAQALTPGLPIDVVTDALIRVRPTLPQAKTRSREERLANLRGAFAWQATGDTSDLRSRNIWLVDDVSTTAATLEECARVLKAQGAREVLGVVVAH